MIPANPAERAITIIELARHGRFDDIRDLFLEQLRPMVSADVLRAAWDTEITRLGPVLSVGAPVVEAGPQHTDSGQGPRHLRTGSNGARRIA